MSAAVVFRVATSATDNATDSRIIASPAASLPWPPRDEHFVEGLDVAVAVAVVAIVVADCELGFGRHNYDLRGCGSTSVSALSSWDVHAILHAGGCDVWDEAVTRTIMPCRIGTRPMSPLTAIINNQYNNGRDQICLRHRTGTARSMPTLLCFWSRISLTRN